MTSGGEDSAGREKLVRHEVSWPRSIDDALNEEVQRRGERDHRYHGVKGEILREALRFYLGSLLARSATGTAGAGSQFRRIREASGRSLRDVAAASGLSPAGLSQIESGAQNPNVRSLQALAVALDVVVVVDRYGVAVHERN
jgi:DNA-binding XRE family transcriptional regulator